jgi:ABC-type transport system substrate-binding protein
LLGFSLEGEGVALFNVSNRQKTTGVFYGADKEAALDAVIAAAIAQYQSPDDHAALVDELQREYVHSHAVWEALNRGEEPPTAPLPPPSLAPSRELDRPDTATGVTLPSRESIAEVLGGAGFAAADNSEGFGVRHEGDRLKVFWVRSDQSGREANVPAMAKALRDFGMKARVAREDNYPYVSVTG